MPNPMTGTVLVEVMKAVEEGGLGSLRWKFAKSHARLLTRRRRRSNEVYTVQALNYSLDNHHDD
jgi:hypothetical protein